LFLAREIVFEDALSTIGVASLGIEGRSGVVRNHSVTTAKGVLDSTPDMVFGSGLDIPDIACLFDAVLALNLKGRGGKKTYQSSQRADRI